MEVVTSLEDSKILEERHVHLRLRRSSSSASISTPSPSVIPPVYHPFGHINNGFHHTTSSPQLRGFWHRKQAGMNRHGLTETELSSLQEHLRTPSPDGKPDETVILTVPKIPRRRRTTTTNSEEADPKEPESRVRRVHVHGGKDKWNWKKGKSKPKFT